MMADPTTALLAIAALTAGHHVGDYWAQSDHQATTKGQCDHEGRMACAGHVASLTAAQALMLALVLGLTGTSISPLAVVLGLSVNAISHYWADRRVTLRGLVLATEPLTRKLGFHDHGGGAAPMDQAFHIAWIVPSALIIAAPVVLAAQLTGGAALVLLACAIASRLARRAERKAAEAAARQDDADENGVDLRA